MAHSHTSTAVRWATSDRGLRYYEPAEGHDVHESSAAASPHLWVDGDHRTVEEAAAMRDALPAGGFRDTLTVAIEGHYQTRQAPTDWQAGDRCELCRSYDTTLVDNVAGCNGCGASEA